MTQENEYASTIPVQVLGGSWNVGRVQMVGSCEEALKHDKKDEKLEEIASWKLI